MTGHTTTQRAPALTHARHRTADWVLKPTSKRILLVGAVVLAGLGVAELLGFGAAIADAGLPPKSPTGPGPS